MKFIVFETVGFTFPVIFPDIVNHCDIAFKDMPVKRGGKIVQLKPTSAGFFRVQNSPLKVVCFGESTSLTLKPNNPRDETLISFLMQNQGSYAFDNSLKLFDRWHWSKGDLKGVKASEASLRIREERNKE